MLAPNRVTTLDFQQWEDIRISSAKARLSATASAE
jgi:hypothetical protein